VVLHRDVRERVVSRRKHSLGKLVRGREVNGAAGCFVPVVRADGEYDLRNAQQQRDDQCARPLAPCAPERLDRELVFAVSPEPERGKRRGGNEQSRRDGRLAEQPSGEIDEGQIADAAEPSSDQQPEEGRCLGLDSAGQPPRRQQYRRDRGDEQKQPRDRDYFSRSLACWIVRSSRYCVAMPSTFLQ
jgi:hypothetical protein